MGLSVKLKIVAGCEKGVNFVLKKNIECGLFLEIVKELGGQMTEDVRDCTVLVADQIKRTAKVSGTNTSIKARSV